MSNYKNFKPSISFKATFGVVTHLTYKNFQLLT